jgi:putative membrane protein
MRNLRLSMVAALACAVVLTTGCKKPQEQTSSTRGATSAAPASLTSEDKQFMTKAAQGSMLEVALGRAVMRQGMSPDVKAFANRMVSDHSKATDELAQIAAKKGVTLPTALDKEHQDTLDKLAKLGGPKLDKEYASDMVEDHEEDVKEFRDAVKSVSDPDLRAWAAKTLPVLESHLAAAKDIKTKTKGTS